jgi:hypothetical protein
MDSHKFVKYLEDPKLGEALSNIEFLYQSGIDRSNNELVWKQLVELINETPFEKVHGQLMSALCVAERNVLSFKLWALVHTLLRSNHGPRVFTLCYADKRRILDYCALARIKLPEIILPYGIIDPYEDIAFVCARELMRVFPATVSASQCFTSLKGLISYYEHHKIITTYTRPDKIPESSYLDSNLIVETCLNYYQDEVVLAAVKVALRLQVWKEYEETIRQIANRLGQRVISAIRQAAISDDCVDFLISFLTSHPELTPAIRDVFVKHRWTLVYPL